MKHIILMSIFTSIFGASAQQLDQIKILEPSDYRNAISNSEQIQLIDVRTRSEFDSGHIANAINVDVMQQESFVNYFKDLDKDNPIYLYCRSGIRSQRAAKQLVQLGFNEIYDLKGGYLNWTNQ